MKECKIICDLLPSYIDELTTEDTNQYIQQHLGNCRDCKKALEEMKKDYFIKLQSFVDNEYNTKTIYPPKEMIFNAFKYNDIDKIKELYKNKYTGPLVTFADDLNENGFISAALLSGKDSMVVSVFGNEDRIILTARYDNLGKGASGAAVECMNLVLGCEATKGLSI